MDLRQGVMAARIAAHVGDMVKLGRRARDHEMGEARRRLDWDRQYGLALDPEHARSVRSSRPGAGGEGCSMCGERCALKISEAALDCS